MNRRKVLQSVVSAGMLATVPVAAGEERPKTPGDFTGPFYPRGPRIGTSDLIVGEPKADVLHLRGLVVAPDGSPHPGVLVDIWQADPNGRYKHPRDSGQDNLMAEFLYWGEATTDADARFEFRTYVPGRIRGTARSAHPLQGLAGRPGTADQPDLFRGTRWYPGTRQVRRSRRAADSGLGAGRRWKRCDGVRDRDLGPASRPWRMDWFKR